MPDSSKEDQGSELAGDARGADTCIEPDSSVRTQDAGGDMRIGREVSRAQDHGITRRDDKKSRKKRRKEERRRARNAAVSTVGEEEEEEEEQISNISGEFFDPSGGTEFIKREDPSPTTVIEQLTMSARFVHEGMEIVLHNLGCLMVVDNDFVAKVQIVLPELLDEVEANSFQDAKANLLGQLLIVRVLQDDRAAEADRWRKSLECSVEQVLRQSTTEDSRIMIIQLSRLVDKFSMSERLSYSDFCNEIKESVSNGMLKLKVSKTLEAEERVHQRMAVLGKLGLPQTDNSQHLYKRLRQLLAENAQHYRDFLKETAPISLKSFIQLVSPERLMLICKNDVKLFADMQSALSKDIFSVPIKDLERRWSEQINSVNPSNIDGIPETTNRIFFFLCKSLEELILEITDKTGISATELLKSTSTGWKSISAIPWKTKNLSAKCLERQYFFLFRLLKHFEMGTNCNRQRFDYDVQLFNHAEKQSSVWSGLKNIVDRTKKFLKPDESRENAFGLPEAMYVWLCLLDDAVVHVLPKEYDLRTIESILQSYLQLIREAEQYQWESVRVTTHNTIQYIVQIVPYLSEAENSLSVDQNILKKQFDIISVKGRSSTSNYRDLMNVFSSYWKFRNDMVAEIVSKMPHPSMNLLKEDLLNVVLIAQEKNVESDNLLAFLRTYEEFLIDLNEVPFDWFIKALGTVDMQPVVALKKVALVDNKWKNTPNENYKVIDPECFPAFCQAMRAEQPKHYVLDILRELLAYVTSQLQRKCWASTNECLSDSDQLTTTHKLLAAVHHSLLYLREQADYVSFELFFDQSVKPFSSLIENSSSEKDFSNRVYLLQESFWFVRKHNEVSVDTVLELYGELNPALDCQRLKEPYERYREHFEAFMQLSIGKDSSSAAVSAMVEKVRELIPEDKHFTTWDVDFKETAVPQILAGLAAVWSVSVSKDVSCTRKYLSPHCIQILCVLRLASVDSLTEGVDKHLAQVLTGQGKSLILALLATLLTLTGHKVRIGCYSGYLVKRDRDAFQSFYDLFEVTSDVVYGSLEGMINEFIKPEVNGEELELRELVKNLVLGDKTYKSNVMVQKNFSTFLIDEVDVFFTEKFYGQEYLPAAVFQIPGLAQIQVRIWDTVSNDCRDPSTIKKQVWNLIHSGRLSHKREFHKFLNRKQKYQLISTNGELKNYTNKSLFDEQLDQMVRNAIEVITDSSHWSQFRLNSWGQITYYSDEKYSSSVYWDYYNVFNYFRLRKDNFYSTVFGASNCGYLNLNCGSLSYAMLPMNYPLIVGVSGTVTALNEYEKQTIDQLYSIKHLSVMPSFFGSSNLSFNQRTDFHHFPTKAGWRSHIFGAANKALAANRAVLVFFETVDELDAFRANYGAQFDRLNRLTEETPEKDRIVNEAGIAKTITLATREMGRGVDYKSSVMVEKNGGVHVIQSFFSMDSKEETQIKGRTARQENRGSYELILWDDDLVRCKLHTRGCYGLSYGTLAAKRNQLFSETNRSISQAIEGNKVRHNKTINYLKSFFKPQSAEAYP